VEFFTGEMAYLHDGHAAYPMRLGHEWCGVVAATGSGVDRSWIGRRVVGDTMLGCGRCHRCRSRRQHLCEHRVEVGISGGKAGALAEQLTAPVSSLHELPDTVDDTTALALVVQGTTAWHLLRTCARISPGESVVVVSAAGGVGSLAVQLAEESGMTLVGFLRGGRMNVYTGHQRVVPTE
jgi:NADPH:quinone reductase-like Zn-dependent oxidoreductase